ncbi:MAG: sugar phosphate isomerase/epimerase family protein, partial [Armatimonadota bacterium]
MTRFALSSAWHASNVTDARELLDVPARLGFDAVELSSVGVELTRPLQQLATAGTLPIVSVHAPCPVPYPGASRLDDLASLDDRRRQASVDYTKATIDLASALGAPVVVLHLGSIEGTIPQRDIFEAVEAQHTSRWKALLAEGLATRRALRDRHLDLCLHSLEILLAHAAGSGVSLGTETRYHYFDLPDVHEFQAILATFGDRGLGYWHDTGHAHLQELLGLAAPGQYLERYHGHLLGLHLHDVRGTRDHLPPGEGEVDFTTLRAYVRAEHARVLEIAGGHPADRVAASLR